MPSPVKTTKEFDSSYAQLNPAQKRAVDAIEGPVMVIAGPGTGKTTILTLRIANILRQTDTAPENILALTFTESGAFAMRRKLVSIIGPSAYRVATHTFHGFAEHIIQQYPDYFPHIIGSTIITDAEQLKIIEKLVQSKEIKLLRPYGDPLYYVKSVLNEIHLLKRENVSPAQLLKSVGISRRRVPEANRPRLKGAEDFAEGQGASKILQKERVLNMSATESEKLEKRDAKNRELTFVYKKYEAELAKQKYYDFDDMLLELIRAMEENPTFKLMLQETYQYILADEHQDANASQNRILELLADFHDIPNLFIVGDDKQAIYRFQGASLKNFLYFKEKYPGAIVIDLEHNYRSHQGILDSSHSLIKNNPEIPGHPLSRLVSLQIGTKPTYVSEFSTDAEELDYLAITINRLIEKKEKAEEIAVLYRENKQAAAVGEALRTAGIPHRIESDRDILGDIDAMKVMMLCRAINNPSDDEALGRALLLPELGCDSADVAHVFYLARRMHEPLHTVIKKLKNRSLRAAYDRIAEWSRDAQVILFPEFLQRLIQETNMVASIVASNDSLERLTSLQLFYDRIADAARSKRTFLLKDLIEYVDVIRDHGIMAKRAPAEHVPGVRLMTAHRAKGLEFNHVFIVNAVDGSWGNRAKRNHFTIPVIEHARDTGRIEDERRLFFVAMTRARESVNISYSHSSDGKERVPSQFLAEIEPSLVSSERPKLSTFGDIFVRKMAAPSSLSRQKPVSILDAGFIRSKFTSQPFSVTHLNNYLECPWRYFFVNLLRVPQAETKHQMYGTAIHSALRVFFDAYRDGRDLSRKKLLDIFQHNLDGQPMSQSDRRESLKKGRDALGGYFDEYRGTWPRQLHTEYAVKGTEIEVSVKKDKADSEPVKIELTGKLDKIEFLNGREIAVIDYKTARPKSRNEIEGKTRSSKAAGEGNYKRQLVFYKMLLDGAGRYDMKYGVIDFIEPNERGIYKKERFEVAADEVRELQILIQKTAKEIIDGSFAEKGCGEKDCEYCKLGKLLG
jgi:DNA helicase-2/ATP-dependent DNA helicase PcrA